MTVDGQVEILVDDDDDAVLGPDDNGPQELNVVTQNIDDDDDTFDDDDSPVGQPTQLNVGNVEDGGNERGFDFFEGNDDATIFNDNNRL